ncbi:MAG: AAA family ATPase [Niallia sp.]
MAALPANKPKQTIEVPRNFFIWGPTMNGKSYLASEFPNPVIFNTDGNANQIETPSVDLKNARDPKTGAITKSVVEQMLELIKELEKGTHTFETVVIDVIDDLITLIEQAICEENGVDYVGDVPYGKGWGLRKTFITSIVVRLKALPMNVIYISRYATKLENNIETPMPSLPDKDLNIVNGNCDLNIMCQKIGKNYLRRVVDRRKVYEREWVQDERLLNILDSLTGAFPKKSKDTSTSALAEEKKSLTELAAEETAVIENKAEQEGPGVSEDDSVPFDVDEEQIAKESAEIEQYVKDNPPPAPPKEDKPKAPRTASPRAPRAPRTK